MRHLTSLKELSKNEILELLDLADNFIDSEGSIRRDPLFPDKKVVNIFCEPSTRTKISFEVAASNLGCQVIDFDLSFCKVDSWKTKPSFDYERILKNGNSEFDEIREFENSILEIAVVFF